MDKKKFSSMFLGNETCHYVFLHNGSSIEVLLDKKYKKHDSLEKEQVNLLAHKKESNKQLTHHEDLEKNY
jgi:hypothetical protein